MTLMVLTALDVSSVRAGAWEWPSSMSIAGFNVSDVRGSANSDGSGSAAGSIQLPVIGSQRISLARSARGDVTGNISVSARVAGAEVQGSFVLDTSGIRGKGTIRCFPKPVNDVSLVVNPNGDMAGSGRMELGRLDVDVRVALSGTSGSIEGLAAAKDVEETPLASYVFDGHLKLQGDCVKMNIAATGTVQRTGKLANQVTQTSVSNISVNPVDGTGKAVVDGVSVTFRFF